MLFRLWPDNNRTINMVRTANVVIAKAVRTVYWTLPRLHGRNAVSRQLETRTKHLSFASA
jgi:hypothetical protein